MSEAGDRRDELVSVGVCAACLVYALSLVAQRAVPTIRDLLALDLGPEVHPTYYLRTGLSLLCGLVVAGARALGRQEPILSERALATATAGLLVAAALLVALFP